MAHGPVPAARSMVRFREGALWGRIRSDLASTAVRAWMREPERLFDRGRPVKQAGNTRTVRLAEAGQEYLLKHYRRRLLLQDLLSVFRGSRAARALARSELFARRGIPTPRPAAMVERRAGMLPVESYILFEFHPGLETLSEAARRLGDRTFLERGFLEGAARDVAGLHGAGLYHGDLKWSNILVGEPAKGIGLLVDLDGAGRLGLRPRRRRARDLSRFLADAYEILEDPAEGARRFLAAYLGAWGADLAEAERLLALVERGTVHRLRRHSGPRGHTLTVPPGEIRSVVQELR